MPHSHHLEPGPLKGLIVVPNVQSEVSLAAASETAKRRLEATSSRVTFTRMLPTSGDPPQGTPDDQVGYFLKVAQLKTAEEGKLFGQLWATGRHPHVGEVAIGDSVNRYEFGKDVDMRCLALPGVTSYRLENLSAEDTARALDAVAHVPCLRMLNLYKCDLPADWLKRVNFAHPNCQLVRLEVVNCSLAGKTGGALLDKDMSTLAAKTSLKFLTLDDEHKVTEKGLEILLDGPMQILRLDDVKAVNKGFASRESWDSIFKKNSKLKVFMNFDFRSMENDSLVKEVHDIAAKMEQRYSTERFLLRGFNGGGAPEWFKEMNLMNRMERCK